MTSPRGSTSQTLRAAAARLTLHFEAEHVPASCTALSVTELSSATAVLIGQTEARETSDGGSGLRWTRGVDVVYRFEADQTLQVQGLMASSVLGDGSDQPSSSSIFIVTFRLAELLTAPGSEASFTARSDLLTALGIDAVKLGIRAIEVDRAAQDFLSFSFSGRSLKDMDWFSKSDPFFVLSRLLPSGGRMKLHTSRTMENDLHPNWPSQLRYSASKLAGGSDLNDKSLLLEVWDEDLLSRELIGAVRFSVSDMLRSAGDVASMLPLVPSVEEALRKAPDAKCHGYVAIRDLEISHKKTFIELLGDGLTLRLAVAFDFPTWADSPQPEAGATAGQPRFKSSTPSYSANYNRAVRTFGEVIMPYAGSSRIRACGYGGQLSNGIISHCFPFTSSHTAELATVSEVLSAYHESRSRVTCSGKRLMAPVIAAVAEQARQAPNTYTVLLVLCSGDVDDSHELLAALAAADASPLSVVIATAKDLPALTQCAPSLDDEGLSAGWSFGGRTRRTLMQLTGLGDGAAGTALRCIPSQVEHWAAEHCSPISKSC